MSRKWKSFFNDANLFHPVPSLYKKTKMLNQLKKQAIDLMLEDLHTKNVDIRSTAKELGCEKELEEIKLNLIEYLCSLKK